MGGRNGVSFATQLEHYLNELSDIRQRGASESALRDAFLRMLRTAFPALSETEPLLIEERIPALRVQGGVADALYGYLIFEFKRRLDANSRAEGKQQLARYLLNQAEPEKYFGVLTDGETLEVYAVRDTDLAQVDSLTLKVEDADAAALWLDCYLFQSRRLRPTSVDVARRFGELSPTFKQSLLTLSKLWEVAQTQSAARTKYIEWANLLSIVYGSEVGDENLFLRHTYLALFARVLAFVALYQRAPEEHEVDELLDGSAFEQIELNNFVGDDFFTWAEYPMLRPLLRSLAIRLATAYDLSAIHEDLLKELYQELVNPQTRHDLGEYYTPDWLAELTLREAGFPPENPEQISLIDPACGSGTFLFTAIRLLRQAGYQGERLIDLCRNLAGIDVQPLAIVIAKTNFVLALGEEQRSSGQPIDLPIYMADSLSLPEKARALIEVPVNVESIAKMKGASPSTVASLPKAFVIPVEVGNFPAQFNALVDRMMLLAAQESLEDTAGDVLEQNLRELNLPPEHASWWRANLRLLRWLMQPPPADTVWQFVLKNACRPALLAHRKFHYVVGNPPWLAYRYIRRRDYQERLRQLAYHYQLLSRKDAHLLTQTELATIFFAFCAHHYLAEGGTLAFVMPRSVLTGAKQHALFRQQYVATARQVIDCEQVSPLFNIPACVVLWQKTARKPRKHIPCLQLIGELPTRNESLESVTRMPNPVLTIRKDNYTPPAITNGSPYLVRVKQGATLVPRNFWFVCRPPETRAMTQNTPFVQTDPRVDAQAKAPWKGIRLKMRIESQFLYATLLSDDLLPFGWRELSPVLLPVRQSRTGELSMYESGLSVMAAGFAPTGAWFIEAEKHWNEKRKSNQHALMEYLNWQGKLTAQRARGVFKLVYNTSGTHLCACVVDTNSIAQTLRDKLPVKGFVADTTTYWIETENDEEAHYLCAVLNAPIVDEIIKPFQAKGAFGAKQGKGQRHIHRRPFEVIPIPLFDSEDKAHTKLALLSRECHQKVSSFVADPAHQLFLSRPTGALRQHLRKQLLAAELAQIDALVRQILAIKPSSEPATGGKDNGVLDL